jgi:hypothetical protein
VLGAALRYLFRAQYNENRPQVMNELIAVVDDEID